MIMKANKQIGFIYKNNESIDKILKDGDVVFERGFLREKTSTTLPITFGGVGKNLKDYKIYGNTYQNSTRGQQLFNIHDNPAYPSNISIVDDYIIFNYTNSGTSSIERTIYTNNLNLQVNTNYLCIAEIIEVNGSGTFRPITQWRTNNRGQFNYDEVGFPFSNLTPGQKILFVAKTKTSFENITQGLRTMCNYAPGESGYLKVRISILADTTITSDTFEYEPYTGEQPSPNPDYPQEIVSCGNKTNNLFDKVNATYKNGYYKNDNGVEQSTQTSGYLTSYIQVKPNTIYTIQGSLKQTNQSLQSYAIYYYNINKQWISRTVITDNPPYTFTTPNDCYFIQFQYRQDVYDENTIQIEEGTTATSYEPYGYKIPVNVRSENLFDKDNYEYITAYLSSSNIITYSGNAVSFYIKCKPNTTYNVSKTSLFGNDRFCLFDTSSLPTVGDIALSYVGTKTGNDNSKDLAITTNPTAQYLCIFVKASTTAPSASIQEIANTLQIVEGSTVPSKYIPYYNETTNIHLDEPLRKIGEYTDYIDFINGKVVRNIDEIILNGSENLTLGYSQEFTNVIRIDLRYVLVGSKAVSKNKIMCDKFISDYGANTDYEHCRNLGTSYVDTFTIHINKLRLSDISTSAKIIESLKTWLITNNTTVDYVLETPTEETIILPDIPTIDGNNTLNIETEITPSQVYIKYKSNS